MDEFPIVTKALVRDIERFLGEMFSETLRIREQHGRAEGLQLKRFGATYATRVPGDARSCQVLAFGPDDLDHLDDILAFYGEDVPSIYLSPAGAVRNVTQALTEAGYYAEGFGQTVTYGVPCTHPPEPSEGVRIERVTEESLEEFLEAMADGFGWDADWREDAKIESRDRFGTSGRYELLARLDGRAAGTGVLTVIGDEGFLGAGAVAPACRNRGCHASLLRARMHLAHELGCRILYSGAGLDATSLRNQQRVGFRIAYFESAWKKVL